ncbi:MAG TPA: hypothetical protein VE842_07545, partial [Pyrinomonadaceae bacterium]|nr:hypothetical protein [Pyrinomonadaceae bacterium]
HDAEFKVFSQFGDDGIIQYLINNIEIEERTFIEFGVENYTESNTRFLLINNNWKGLVMDGSAAHIEYIKSDSIYWRHELTAVHGFIDKENVNGLISDNGFSGALGILSIDIDGNDYWIWECIREVEPAIVIIEYNSVFGKSRAITIPYDAAFNRTRAHPSNLYWGASLRAMCLLAEKKGYVFVGSNSSGNNAYFVRKDKLGPIRALDPESGYVKSRFRESLDEHGRLTYLSDAERLKAIEEMIVYDLEKESLVKIKSLDAVASGS